MVEDRVDRVSLRSNVWTGRILSVLDVSITEVKFN